MLGDNIKKIRTEKQLSLRALSEKSGISKTTINEIENGIVTNPTLDTIQKIAKALDTTSEELFDTFGKLAQLIDDSRFGDTFEEFSNGTGIPIEYLIRLCDGDISEPPPTDILQKISDYPNNILVDYLELLEAAGYIDRKTEQIMRKERRGKFDETIDSNRLKNAVDFLENNLSLVEYFKSVNFTPDEVEKIIDYMNFVISQRDKK